MPVRANAQALPPAVLADSAEPRAAVTAVSFDPDQSGWHRLELFLDTAFVAAAEEGSGSGEQPLEQVSDPLDGLIEVFTLAGRLVAPTRYDDGREMPFPITSSVPGDLWYRLTDGLTRSIEILRPVLVPGAVRP